MLTCLIVDDEQHAIDILSRFVQDNPYLRLVGSTINVLEAHQILKEQEIDILFLDIHMPKLSGLQFLEMFEGRTKVILTTAYPEYALDSYQYNVVDYLVKPISFERFFKATQKALNIVNQTILEGSNFDKKEFIFVKTECKGKFRKINFDEITYIEGMKNYVSIFTSKDNRIITYVGIGNMVESLPQNRFVRVHRSYIVPVDKIEAVDGNEVIMKGVPRIPIGDKYKDLFMHSLQQQMVTGKKVASVA